MLSPGGTPSGEQNMSQARKHCAWSPGPGQAVGSNPSSSCHVVSPSGLAFEEELVDLKGVPRATSPQQPWACFLTASPGFPSKFQGPDVPGTPPPHQKCF